MDTDLHGDIPQLAPALHSFENVQLENRTTSPNSTKSPNDIDQHDFRVLLDTVSDYAVYMLDKDGIVVTWNKGAQRNKGYTAEEVIGSSVAIFYTPEDRAAGAPGAMLRAARVGKHEAYGWRVRKDGTRFWARVVVEAIHDPLGLHTGFAKVTCDVSAQKRDHDRLTRNLDAALSHMSQGLCLFDQEERVILANARMAAICGLPSPDPMAGATFRDVLRWMFRSQPGGPHTSRDHAYEQHRTLVLNPKGGSVVLTFASDLVLSVVHCPMADGSWVTTVEDISERSRSQGQIAHMALHDALTDLPNRIKFRQRLEDALHRVKRGQKAAVLCLDLDKFKAVNDTLGHPVGDALLVAIAEQLRQLVRDTDTVARLGGDEFAIVQTDIGHPRDATVLAERVIRQLSLPLDISGHRIASGVSIGIALAPDDGMDPDQLLKAADLALYRAKAQGRNRYCYFELEMDALLQERSLLELELRTALASGEFELYYQPIIDMENDVICGFEALLRWHSPRRGMVPPVEFIPLAEETGLIVDIGTWVLKTACAEATSWPDDIKLAVNVSVAQFKGFGLIDAVRSALAHSGLPAQRLEIEITESIMIHDSQHACAVLHALKDLGLSISMDDFGTGYSSLGYLRSFPFDKIKIDRSFVQGLGEAADCSAIIQAVLGICDSLGIIATAEGVETEDQMSLLRSKRCHQAQGYLFSQPRAASDIPGIIRDVHQRRRRPDRDDLARDMPALASAGPRIALGVVGGDRFEPQKHAASQVTPD